MNITRRSIPRPQPPVGGRPYYTFASGQGSPFSQPAHLESIEEGLVLEHGLVVTRGLVLGLSHIRQLPAMASDLVPERQTVLSARTDRSTPCMHCRAPCLVRRQPERASRVTQRTADEQLEPLSEAGDGAMILSQRRHDLRVVAEEGGRIKGRLQVLSDQLVDQSRGGARRRTQNLAKLQC